MINPFKPIVNFEDYKEIIGVPKEQLNNVETQNRINKWLVQATEQFDSMISGSGELGRLYRWHNDLKDNNEDNYKKYKLKKAICSWVETFVIKGKFWVDGVPNINSNVNIEINASSEDSNVERKRKDIIQDLVALGIYRTTNFGNGNINEEAELKKQFENLAILTKQELNDNYLKVKPQKPLQGPLDMANNDMVNGGNISGNISHARNYIKNYEIIESTINFDKNNIIGNVTTANKANAILDPISNVYKMINQFDAHYFGTLTTQEIYNAIYASGMEWRPDILYKEKYITQRINNKGQLFFYEALQENINKDPMLPENNVYWKKLTTQDIDINLVLEQLKDQIPILVEKEINKQPQLDLIMEAEGQIIDFPNEDSFNQFKQQYNIDDTWFEDVQEQEQQPKEVIFEDEVLLETQNPQQFNPGRGVGFGFDLQRLIPKNVSSLWITLWANNKFQTIEITINDFLKRKIANNENIHIQSVQKFYTPTNAIINALISLKRQEGAAELNGSISFDNSAAMEIYYAVGIRKVK